MNPESMDTAGIGVDRPGEHKTTLNAKVKKPTANMRKKMMMQRASFSRKASWVVGVFLPQQVSANVGMKKVMAFAKKTQALRHVDTGL